MNALFVIFLIWNFKLSCSVLVDHTHDRKVIKAKTRVELHPIDVDTRLNAIIKLTPPILSLPEIIFVELIKPDGDVFSLDDNITNTDPLFVHLDDNIPQEFSVATRRVKMRKSYEIIDIKKNTTFDGLVIGPLIEENHGNWVLSAYFKDVDDKWVEMFQVITISITEYIPNHQNEVRRRILDDFHLSFAYPIKGLESCELIPPKGASKDKIKRQEDNICGYIVRNITKNEEGLWEIVGVGKIIYRGQTKLEVINKIHVKF